MPTGLSENEWRKQTREERQFCADLYCLLRNDPKKFKQFVRLVNTEAKKCTDLWSPLDETADWEIGVEVAFYRDNANVAGNCYRKFDLALFSEGQFVIIEAKAQSGFARSSNCVHMRPNGENRPEECELCKFELDRELINTRLIETEVYLIGLCSSKYLLSRKRQVPICVDLSHVSRHPR